MHKNGIPSTYLFQAFEKPNDTFELILRERLDLVGTF
jgi:hypothetical protein